MATTYQFAHHRTVDGERCLIWGNGIGEVLVPVASPEYHEALRDRSWQDNDLANEGEQDILNVYFRTLAKRSNLYGRLFNDTPVDTDTLATLTGEVTGTGYAAVTWAVSDAGFPTLVLDLGDYKVTSSTQTFTAGGVWTTATSLALATVASGTAGLFISWVMLSAARNMVSTDTFDASIATKLA